MGALFNENPEEYRSKNRKIKKERDEVTEMCESLRSNLMSVSTNNYEKFVQIVIDNKETFKYHFSAGDKEALRNVCQNTMHRFYNKVEKEHRVLFDEVFGYYLPPEPMIAGRPPTPRIERELRYFSDCTYEVFYNWLANPDTQKKLNYHPAVKELLSKAIEEQRFKNIRVSDKHKGYEPEDEELFRKVLA